MRSHQIQAPGAVVMVRPHHFTPNPETAVDNAFQLPRPDLSAERLAGRVAPIRQVEAEHLG